MGTRPPPIRADVPLARTAPRRYGMAVLAVGAAALCRVLIAPVVSAEAPFLLFFAAVMAAGWYGGFLPGLAATVLSSAAAAAYLGDPPAELGYGPVAWAVLRVGVFAFEGLVTSALCGQLHAARRRAEHNAAEARELERTVEQISEAEHRRIGQDLHDGLGQHLTGVAFLSKALQQRLAADGRAESAEAAATINQLVNESIRWTRDLARGLAPMDLDHASLPESLRDLARKTSRMFSVECAYDGVEAVRLGDDETALNLYRVAQEAVSNAVKHGKARRVTIDLEVGPPGLTLSVQDDGVGFDPAAVVAAPGHKGMGLLVMRYRAGVIGGRLDVLAADGGGTVVRCRMPPELARATVVTADPPSWPTGGSPPRALVPERAPTL